MQWATFTTLQEPDEHRVGIVQGSSLLAMHKGVRLVDLISRGQEALLQAGETLTRTTNETYDVNNIRLLPPIPNPPSIRDFSSFEEHVRVSLKNVGYAIHETWSQAPVFYFSSPNNLFGHDSIVRAHGDSQQMDYELEICAIIGQGGMDIPPETATNHIAGYAIFNDWSARDLQIAEMQRMPIGPGKGKDCATSIGPYLVTPDVLHDRKTSTGFDLDMTARVNGVEYSRGNWSSITWSFAQMIAFASRSSPLVPGDIIGSGTVGTGCIVEISGTHGANKFPWLKENDIVELEVDRLGVLRNRIQWNKPPVPLR